MVFEPWPLCPNELDGSYILSGWPRISSYRFQSRAAVPPQGRQGTCRSHLHIHISETKLRARAAQGSGTPFSIQSPLIGWNFYTRHSRPRDWDPNHPHFNSLVGWEVPHSEKEALNVDYHSWPAPSSQNGGITLRDVVLCPCTQLWNSDSDIFPMGRGRP